jgi:hypothetical protein
VRDNLGNLTRKKSKENDSPRVIPSIVSLEFPISILFDGRGQQPDMKIPIFISSSIGSQDESKSSILCISIRLRWIRRKELGK